MKYLNFEGLQYFYSKLSSSLAGKYVSLSNLKTINGQSLLGSGNITIEGGSISQQDENIIVSLGDDSLTINGENTKTIEFFYNNRLVTGLDLNDYLPLSGGTMTGNLNMTSDEPILTMTSTNSANAIVLNASEDDTSTAKIDLSSSDGSTEINLSTSEGVALLNSNYLWFSDNLGQDKAKYTDFNMQIGTSEGDNIRITSSGITKNGGSPTKVFATDGSVVDMNAYLPLSGGNITGDIARQTPKGTQLVNIGTNGNVAMNEGTGQIRCVNIGYADSILSGDSLIISRLGTRSDTEPNYIQYSFDNIHISIDPSGVRHTYKFNIQKLIDDGYLIEE